METSSRELIRNCVQTAGNSHSQPLADHADHPSPKGDIRGLVPTNRGYTATQENPLKGDTSALSRMDRRSAAKSEGGEI
jgi:hypothetical protein